MKLHRLPQGSQEWHAHRAQHFNASDAAAMLGCSPHMTRTQLLHAMHTGIRAEADENTQRRFDKGHEIEALKRPAAEAVIGEDLYPVVGTEGELSASFDGLTMLQDTNWECKSLNADLRAALPNKGPDGNDAANLPKCYRVQMEQQCAVSGCTRVLFTASDGYDDDRHCWYTPDPALRAEIIAGWKQFAEDLATYKPVEIQEMPKAEVTLALPALFIQAKGEITTSNMEAYGIALAAKLKSIRAIQLITDQDFSNAKESAEMLRENIQKAKLAKEAMLAQTVTVGEAALMIDAWCEDMRLTALKLEKDVEREDKAKKAAMIDAAKGKYAQHVQELDREIAPARINLAAPVFAEAIKNRRSFASMQDALDTMLATAKIAANEIAATIRFNREQLRPQNGVAGEDWISLFPDFTTVCTKSRDDFHNLVSARVAAHVQRLAAERDRIRAEEVARLEGEQKARDKEAARVAAQTAAPVAAPAAAPAPIAAPASATQAAAANAPTVVPLRAAAPTSPPSLKLGDINARIAPMSIDAAGLAQLGFPHITTDRSAKLYHEADFSRMLDSLVAHLRTAQAKQLHAA